MNKKSKSYSKARKKDTALQKKIIAMHNERPDLSLKGIVEELKIPTLNISKVNAVLTNYYKKKIGAAIKEAPRKAKVIDHRLPPGKTPMSYNEDDYGKIHGFRNIKWAMKMLDLEPAKEGCAIPLTVGDINTDERKSIFTRTSNSNKNYSRYKLAKKQAT